MLLRQNLILLCSFVMFYWNHVWKNKQHCIKLSFVTGNTEQKCFGGRTQGLPAQLSTCHTFSENPGVFSSLLHSSQLISFLHYTTAPVILNYHTSTLS